MVQMITDRYKLFNINLNANDLLIDNIKSTMENVCTLIHCYNLTKVNITYDLMKFIMNSKKIVEIEKNIAA